MQSMDVISRLRTERPLKLSFLKGTLKPKSKPPPEPEPRSGVGSGSDRISAAAMELSEADSRGDAEAQMAAAIRAVDGTSADSEDEPVTQVTFEAAGPLGIVWVQKDDRAVIKRIKPSGRAAARQELQPGMVLMAVGDRRGLTYPEAIGAIKAGSSKPPLKLGFKGTVDVTSEPTTPTAGSQ
jgi:hypothetical protein